MLGPRTPGLGIEATRCTHWVSLPALVAATLLLGVGVWTDSPPLPDGPRRRAGTLV